jgi:hypothetical protein
VIKQGKLHDAEKAVGAAELQDMVRFGANRIFQSVIHTYLSLFLTHFDVYSTLVGLPTVALFISFFLYISVCRGTDTEITDADIDLILSRGREMTTAETEKLKQTAGADLLNFSLSNDAQTNFQVFEGKDYTGTRAKTGFEFIEPAARSRKSNYDINAYYRDALRVSEKKGGRGAIKEWKPTQRYDYRKDTITDMD